MDHYFKNNYKKYEYGKTLMDLLKEFAPELAKHQLEEKDLLFEKDKYQAIPKKYKLLVGISATAVLNSDTCTRMWLKQAESAGVTNAEITKTIMVARYMKLAVVKNTAPNALGLISDNKL